MKYKAYNIDNEIVTDYFFRLFFLFILFLSVNTYGADRPEKEIDSLLMLSDHAISGDYPKALMYAEKACRIAEKEGSSEKKAWSYYYMAKSLALVKKFRQSAQYTDKGLQEEYTEQTPLLKAILKLVKVSIYSSLGMNKLMAEESDEVLHILGDDLSVEARIVKAKTLYGLSLAVNDPKQSDDYAHQCQQILRQIPEKEYGAVKMIFKFKSYFYNIRGEIFLERKNLDSAQYYIFQAYHYSFREGFVHKNTFLNSIGNLYYTKGDQKKALEYYLKALSDINRYDKNSFAANGPGLLKSIYTIYQSLGDHKNYRLYYEQYQAAHEHFSNHLNHEVLVTTNTLIDEKVSEHAEEKQYRTLWLAVVIVSAGCLLGFFFYYHAKTQRKKDLLIRQKETVLLKAEQEASTLSMKVEDALNEVLEAAKNNLPEFWPLFQKLYPDFSKKILSANPDIKTSELILCAYAFLGFTTKDIAVYTFKAIQTVKNNKHNLRKRLNIPPKQDLNIWLRDFYQS